MSKSNILKAFTIAAIVLISALSSDAKVTWQGGDMSYLLFAKKIPVTLTYSNAVFAGIGDFNDFMLMAKRDSDWYEKNLEEFYEHANEEFAYKGFGLTFLAPEDVENPKCHLNIDIKNIERNGHISGKIYVIDSQTAKPVIVFKYVSDDADPVDDDVFKDQLESIGESFGKLLRKDLNKALKQLSK